MILNTTNVPSTTHFSAMQRLAANGELVVDEHVRSIEQFIDVFKKYINVTKVIVDSEDFVLANDIINYVTCPVVTLRIETIGDDWKVNFLPYEDEENDL